MSMTKHTIMKAGRNTAGDDIAFEAVGADGLYLEFDAVHDERLLLLVSNAAAAAKTVTIAAGNGVNAPAGNLTVSIAASKTKGFVFDSSRYMQLTGSNRGRVLITGEDATNVKIAAIDLAV